MDVVATLAAFAAGGPEATMTSTARRTNSVACAGRRSYWPSAKRYSITRCCPQQTRLLSAPVEMLPPDAPSGFEIPHSEIRPPALAVAHALLAARSRATANHLNEIAPSHASPQGSGQGTVAGKTRVGKGRPNVRFGSKADICSAKEHVRYSPKSGHQPATLPCPLCAMNGYRAVKSHQLKLVICKRSSWALLRTASFEQQHLSDDLVKLQRLCHDRIPFRTGGRAPLAMLG